MSFQLKTSYFEGPLELLLDLIEGKKLHVSEISLAEVTEEYLNYLNLFSEIPEEDERHKFMMLDRSQFIVVAATLILIKARSLLPTIELSEEETESIDDLTERLRLYEIVKRYGEMLHQQFSKKHKDLRKFQAQVLNMEEQKFIDTRYTPELVSSLIKQPVDSVIIFMNSYPMEYDFARAASDLEIKMWIKYNYQEFTNSKPKKKVK